MFPEYPFYNNTVPHSLPNDISKHELVSSQTHFSLVQPLCLSLFFPASHEHVLLHMLFDLPREN